MAVQTDPSRVSDPVALIDVAVRAAIRDALGDDHADADPVIRTSQNPDFGDFQANAAMGLAKKVGAKPRDLAELIVKAIDLGDLADPPEIAGPGFINIRLRPEALGQPPRGDGRSERPGRARASDDTHPIAVDHLLA